MALPLQDIASLGVFVIVGSMSIALLFLWWYYGMKNKRSKEAQSKERETPLDS